MERYTGETYGERIAEMYDELYPRYDEQAVATLAGLAGGGPALELGIGTGRIALPLQARGVQVHGIDISPAMVARLRAKPGGESIPVTLGSFSDITVASEFSLIYVLFNTFFDLQTQEEQVHCFASAASRLAPGGVFVIEVFVPDLSRYPGGQSLRTISLGTGEARLDAALLDPVSQQVTAQHIIIGEQGVRLYPVKLRFAYPSELDLMARLAGLRLRHRWGDWARGAFTADSGKHISVYERMSARCS